MMHKSSSNSRSLWRNIRLEIHNLQARERTAMNLSWSKTEYISCKYFQQLLANRQSQKICLKVDSLQGMKNKAPYRSLLYIITESNSVNLIRLLMSTAATRRTLCSQDETSLETLCSCTPRCTIDVQNISPKFNHNICILYVYLLI